MGRKISQEREMDGAIRDFRRRTNGSPQTEKSSPRAPRNRHWKGRVKILLVMLTLFTCVAIFWPYHQTAAQWKPGGDAHRAVIVDSLSATDPDPNFISNASRTLSIAGYSVDYFGPSQVSVDLFRNLPLMGYSILIFRTHTAQGAMAPPGQDIVTHQPYTTSQYSFEQLANRLAEAVVRPGDHFFAITPSFISDENAGVGGYHGALVIQMGCSTLQARPDLATAYFERGASAFVGWNGVVSSYYTDVSTELLLASLMHGNTLQQAIGAAGGPDPDWGGQMTYIYPSSVSQQMLIDQVAAIVVWAVILTPALWLARRQGIFLDVRRIFKKSNRSVSKMETGHEKAQRRLV